MTNAPTALLYFFFFTVRQEIQIEVHVDHQEIKSKHNNRRKEKKLHK